MSISWEKANRRKDEAIMLDLITNLKKESEIPLSLIDEVDDQSTATGQRWTETGGISLAQHTPFATLAGHCCRVESS